MGLFDRKAKNQNQDNYDSSVSRGSPNSSMDYNPRNADSNMKPAVSIPNQATSTGAQISTQPDQGDQDTSRFQKGTKLQFEPIGASGTQLFSGYFTEEYLVQLRGRKGAKIFDEMRRSETQVAMLMNGVMNPIKSGNWDFEAADEAIVPDAKKHRDLIEFCAKDGIDWETHVHEALTMLIHGYSLFEIINNVVFDDPKFGTFNGLKGIAFRNQKTIERWNVDSETGRLQTVDQWILGDLAKDRSALLKMNADFLLVFSLQKEGDNYEGISALRPMYGPWFRKNLYLKIAGIGIERNAMGTPIGTIPKNNATKEEIGNFATTLENFVGHETSYLMKPEGWSIDVIKGEFNATAVKEMILLENTEMINSLVANFLALGTNSSGGAFALGESLADFFLSGIQSYANIICGVWNRKLIPDLNKMNYGPQRAYPKLKATGITDKAGKELAEVVQILSNVSGIIPDMPLEEFLRKQYKMPKADPTTAREIIKVTERIDPAADPGAVPQFDPTGKPTTAPQIKTTVPKTASITPKQLGELRLQLAETYKKQWDIDKANLKALMQEHLRAMLDDYKAQIKREWKGSTKATRPRIALNLKPKLSNYRAALKEQLAQVANNALQSARKATPKASKLKIKLSESIQLAAPKGGYFQALPTDIQRIISTQSELIATTQDADLTKIVSFQFMSSEASTDNVDQVLTNIESIAGDTIDGATGQGMSVDAAAGNAVSSTFNQAQLDWFFEPEVLNTLESFTFVNEDPVSEICQELAGTTWSVDDPDLDKYSPPLHHNCKSRLEPNEKDTEGNPDITGTESISQKAIDSITLCECDFHLKL